MGQLWQPLSHCAEQHRKRSGFHLSFSFASDDNILSFPWVIVVMAKVAHSGARIKLISFLSDHNSKLSRACHRVRLKWQLAMKPECRPNFPTGAAIRWKYALLR